MNVLSISIGIIGAFVLSACRAPKSGAVASKDAAAVAGTKLLDTTYVLHKTMTDSGAVYRGEVIVSDSTKSDRAFELKERFLSAKRGSADSRSDAGPGVRLTIDSIYVCLKPSGPIDLGEEANPLVLGPGSFGANVTIANHSPKSVLLFPPSYGQYLSIFKTEVKFGDSTFAPILRTDIDYAPYEAEKILPGGKKSFRMSFSMYDMYDKDEQGHATPIGSGKYERLLRSMKSVSIRYETKFAEFDTVWDGETKSVERSPMFGRYTVLDLLDTFQVFRY